MFIIESIAEEIQCRIEKAKPARVWGLLLGKNNKVNKIIQVIHLSNISNQPDIFIDISFELIARQFKDLQKYDHVILGYYYSCTAKIEVPEIIEKLPFPDIYYSLCLLNTPQQLQWEMERVDKVTNSRMRESLTRGTPEQIEQYIQNALREKFTSSKSIDTSINLTNDIKTRNLHQPSREPQNKQAIFQRKEWPRNFNITTHPLSNTGKKPGETTQIDEYDESDKKILSKYKIHYLYHMTHYSNINSILEWGLLSRNKAYQCNLIPHQIADREVVDRRSLRKDGIYFRPINDYVPLYFNPKNPMLYVLKDIQNEIIILGFNPILLLNRNTVFSDGNSASSNTKFYNHITELKQLNWQCIHGRTWKDFDDGRRIRCAEVLVYQQISIKYLKAIFVPNERAFIKLRDYLYTEIRDVPILVDPDLYF